MAAPSSEVPVTFLDEKATPNFASAAHRISKMLGAALGGSFPTAISLHTRAVSPRNETWQTGATNLHSRTNCIGTGCDCNQLLNKACC
jgi:uncharacterized protein YktB (UPF0637 family)